jgi:acyl transferase domain-containing protein
MACGTLQEALAADPQHRTLLEGALQLLLPLRAKCSGDPSHQMRGSGTSTVFDSMGVYVGVSWTEYHTLAKAAVGHQAGRSRSLALGPYAAQGAVLRCVLGYAAMQALGRA